MESIIRSNAVETSSQAGTFGMKLHNFHPYYNLTSEIGLISGVCVASATEALLKSTTGIWSISLHQQPKYFSCVFLLSGVVLTTFLVWAWTREIEQVSHVTEKFLRKGELGQIASVAILAAVFHPSIYLQVQQKIQQLAQIRVVQAKAEAKTPLHAAKAKLQLEFLYGLVNIAIQILTEIAFFGAWLISAVILPHEEADKLQIKGDAYPNLDCGITSGKVGSIVDAQADEHTWFYPVELPWDCYHITDNNKITSFKEQETATGKNIRDSRLAEMFF